MSEASDAWAEIKDLIDERLDYDLYQGIVPEIEILDDFFSGVGRCTRQ